MIDMDEIHAKLRRITRGNHTPPGIQRTLLREDVPALLAEVSDLRAKLAEAERRADAAETVMAEYAYGEKLKATQKALAEAEKDRDEARRLLAATEQQMLRQAQYANAFTEELREEREKRDKLVEAARRLASTEGFVAIGSIPGDQWGAELKARIAFAAAALAPFQPTEEPSHPSPAERPDLYQARWPPPQEKPE